MFGRVPNRPCCPPRASWFSKYVPTAGCVLWMPGQDDAYSSTIRDRSGSANNGTIHTATWTRNSRGLWYLSHDGASDYTDCGNPASLQIAGSFSLLAWANPTANNDDWLTIISKHNHEADGEAGFEIKFSPGEPNDESGLPEGGIFWKVHESDTPDVKVVVLSNTAAVYGTWNLVVGTFESGSHASIFLNGALDNSEDTAITTVQNTPQEFLIGAEGGVAGPRRKMYGGLALPRVIDGIALSAEQVRGIFNQERHLFGV